VALLCDPNGSVSVDVSFDSGDPDIAVATAMPLLFDSSNYWIAQSVALAAAEDADPWEKSAIFSVTASDIAPETVVAWEVENDVPADVLYVDSAATGAGDGTSWSDGYPDLHDALLVAAAFPQVEHVRVADGTYKPDASGLADPREATFQLVSGVAIQGGYAGFGAPDPDARDMALYETVLSGDIGTSDDSTDNCYHVVTGSGTDATAMLDGVTVTGGNANGSSPHNKGGGMLNEAGSPTLYACSVIANNAADAGGGMQNFGGNPILINCVFAGNTADDGGGINNGVGGTCLLVNCTLSENTAADDGGGVRNYDSTATATNCIFWGNKASSGAQIRNDGGASVTVTYSCIQGGWSGEGNIDANPMFVRDPSPGADNEWGTPDDDYGDLHLGCGSPCLDVGTNTTAPPLPDTDADGGARIIGGVVDMGAYEGMGGNSFVVTPPSVEVPEGGSAEFALALGCDPNGAVSVGVSFESGDPDIAVATAMPLTFDSSDYWIAQPVTLVAAEDPDQREGSAIIAVTASGFRTARVSAREYENDASALVYVDQNATDPPDGSSWCSAYRTLDAALAVAADSPEIVEEIHVADGTYTPDTSGLADPREATFHLASGLVIEGGYAGCGAPDPDVRDIAAYETILTGDIGTPGDIADNCYHVVTALNVDDTGVLDGFSVTSGNANGEGHDAGGGMLNSFSSATISNCMFTDSHAKLCGGGMFNLASSPTIEACQFVGNRVNNDPFEDDFGGGMCNEDGSQPALVGCTFSDNWADIGGAIYNGWRDEGTHATFTDCFFVSNEAWIGGAISSDYAGVDLLRCTFTGNKAYYYGAALYVWEGTCTAQSSHFAGNYAYHGAGAVLGARSTLEFTECTFMGNSTREGSGGAMAAGEFVTLTRCNFFGNEASSGGALSGGTVVRECTFVGNHALNDGGAIVTSSGDDWVGQITDCSFVGNFADDSGGGIHIYVNNDWLGELSRCVFSGNGAGLSAGGSGGALWVRLGRGDDYPLLRNSLVVGNWAGLNGAGASFSGGRTAVADCLFYGNQLSRGTAAIYVNSDVRFSVSGAVMWGNGDPSSPGAGLYARSPGLLTVKYSCLQAWTGKNLDYVEGNIIADPRLPSPLVGTWTAVGHYDPNTFEVLLTDTNASWIDDELVGQFVNPDTSQALQFPVLANTADTITIWSDWATIDADVSWVAAGADYAIYDYHLQSDSPCINRGDPAYVTDPNDVDMDGDPRVVHGRVDIGADEYTGALPPSKPALVATDAPPNGTWPKTQNNFLRLSFDMPITLPGGDPLSIVELGDPNSDVSSAFTYQIDPEDPNGQTLEASEDGAMLANQTWYRVTPVPGFDVHLFEVDVCTLIGDADGTRRVTTADYSAVKADLGERTDVRCDLNGSGRVTAADYSVVKAYLGDVAPAKP